MFGAPFNYALSSEPSGLVVGDFNGDGQPDLALPIGAFNTDLIDILIGHPDGGFANLQTFPGGMQPESGAAGDFNGDGLDDLAVVVGNSGQEGVLFALGDGGFAPEVLIPGVSSPGDSMTAGRLRGPTAPLDLIIGDSNYVYVVGGDGDGGFLPAVRFSAVPTSTIVSGAPITGDFNRDSNLDIAIADFGGAAASVLLGYGDGGFSPAMVFPSGDPGSNADADAVRAADIDSDGDLDLLTSNFDGTLSILFGSPDGGFALGVQIPSAGGLLAIADFDGDGHPDLALGRGGAITVLLGYGDGGFATLAAIPTTNGATPNYGVVADFNDDGHPDLAVGVVNSTVGGVDIFLNQTR